jgi:hypothetical protein
MNNVLCRPIITAEEREMLLDHIASESSPTTAPAELTEKQREACHSDFDDSNGMDLLAELSNDMTDAQAIAFVRRWKDKLLAAECEARVELERNWW